jgi:hypothetical protein
MREISGGAARILHGSMKTPAFSRAAAPDAAVFRRGFNS